MVEISALKGTGTKEAAEAAVRMAGTGRPAQHLLFAPEIEDALKIIAGRIRGKVEEEHLRWYAVKLFERDAKAMEKISAASEPDAEITSAIEACEKKLDDDSESIITDQRYQKIGKMLAGGTRKKVQGQLSVSDKIDRIVTNRWLALPIFAIVMFLVYYVSVSTVGDILTGFTNDTLFGGVDCGTGAGMARGHRDARAGWWGWSWTASSAVWARCSGLFPRCLCCSYSWPFWRTAATWRASPLLWIACSANLGFRANPLFPCSSARGAACPALWLPAPLKMIGIAR